MPFSDEFDLDLVTSGNGIPGGNQPQSTLLSHIPPRLMTVAIRRGGMH